VIDDAELCAAPYALGSIIDPKRFVVGRDELKPDCIALLLR
jgi:hypothetical protein